MPAEKQQVQIVRINNPLIRSDRTVIPVEHRNQTVAEMCMQVVPAEIDFAVSINGAIIPAEQWSITRPGPGDLVGIVPILHGGDDDKEILGIAAMVALAVFAPGLGAGMAGAFGLGASKLAVGLFTAGIMVGGGMLINSIMPTPTPPNMAALDFDRSQMYGWNPVTRQQQGIVKPVFYGANKLYGNVVAVHTTPSGSDLTEQVLKMVVALGEGPVKGITQSDGVNDDIFINGQRIINFSSVTTEEKLGTYNQSAVSFMTETKAEYRPNITVSNAATKSWTTPDNDYDDLDVELWFPRGIYEFVNGSLSDHGVGIKVDIREASGPGAWNTLVLETVTGSVTGIIRKNYTASGTYTGGAPVTITNGNRYEIRITKTTADDSSANVGDELRLGAVREVFTDDFEYPGTHILALSAVAGTELSGGIEAACIAECKIIRTYNGSVFTIEYSNSPAWVLYDILTQPVITGDGGGTPYAVDRFRGLDPALLDIASFFALAQYWDQSVPDGEGGTETRGTFNGGFDVGTTPLEAALKVCEMARCILVPNGRGWSIAIDKPAAASWAFNDDAIVRGSFEQTWLPQAERISELEIQFRDSLADYKRTAFTIENPNINNPDKRDTLELFGIIFHSQAWRAGRHRLAQNLFLRWTATFRTDVEAIGCVVGDIVKLQHGTPQWGKPGMVVSGSTTHVITGRDLVCVDDAIYDCNIRLADPAGGTAELIYEKTLTNRYNPITAVNMGNGTFAIENDFTANYKQGDAITVADSTGNDKTYTIATDSTFGGGVTTITVNESIPDAAADGGLYNNRRIVPTTAFATAPAADDLVLYGKQKIDTELVRILGIESAPDHTRQITVIQYDIRVYDGEEISAVIPIAGYTTPASDDNITLPPNLDQINNLYPTNIFESLNTDVPLIFNVAFTDDSPGGGSVAWAADDGTKPISMLFRGTAYEITAANTANKFIYWHDGATTVLSSTDSIATVLSNDGWVMAVNESGTHTKVLSSPALHAGILQAGTITAAGAQIGSLAVDTAQIANLAVGTIKIEDEATVVFETATTAGEGGEIPATYTTYQTITFTSLGGVVNLSYEVNCRNDDAVLSAQVFNRIVDSVVGTSILGGDTVSLDPLETKRAKEFGQYFPGAGTYTLWLQCRSTSTADTYPSARTMTAIESKGK